MFAKRNMYNRGDPKFQKDKNKKFSKYGKKPDVEEKVLEGDIKFENTPEATIFNITN